MKNTNTVSMAGRAGPERRCRTEFIFSTPELFTGRLAIGPYLVFRNHQPSIFERCH